MHYCEPILTIILNNPTSIEHLTHYSPSLSSNYAHPPLTTSFPLGGKGRGKYFLIIFLSELFKHHKPQTASICTKPGKAKAKAATLAVLPRFLWVHWLWALGNSLVPVRQRSLVLTRLPALANWASSNGCLYEIIQKNTSPRKGEARN